MTTLNEEIDDLVSDCHLHISEGNHDDRWEFITTLGQRLDTNFGFKFDPDTGKTYPDNDPRR